MKNEQERRGRIIRTAIGSMLAVILLLTGCKAEITSGEVTEKNFSPAHTQVMLMPLCISNGSSITTTLMPFIYHYADQWTVTITTWDEKSGEMQSATYRVTETVYDEVEIGAEFTYSKDMQPTEPEYTRERLEE